MKWSAELIVLVPPAVVTVRSTTPADPAGEVALHEVVEAQLTDVPALAPKATVVEPTTKPVPEMVTTSPPLVVPAAGLIPVTLGRAS